MINNWTDWKLIIKIDPQPFSWLEIKMKVTLFNSNMIYNKIITVLFRLGVLFSCDFVLKMDNLILRRTVSNPWKMSLGVPQGLVLGPLFFSIFINDLSFALILHSKHFADDTTFYKTFDLKARCFEITSEFKNELSPFIHWRKFSRLDVYWLKTFMATRNQNTGR